MSTREVVSALPVENAEWIGFPGGELEGQRPKALCPSCRGLAAAHAFKPGTLCFQCYRLELERERALRAAGHLNTATEERFQTTLPFERVDAPRLERLRGERAMARAELQRSPTGRFEDRRRRAQIAARQALQRVSAGLAARDASGRLVLSADEGRQTLAAAAHGAELQLPESWLPFVLAR
jgi:hypothetical protein